MVITQACKLSCQCLCSTATIVLTMLRSILLVCIFYSIYMVLEWSQWFELDQSICLLSINKNTPLTCWHIFVSIYNIASNTQICCATLICIRLFLWQVYLCSKDHVHHKLSRSKTHRCSYTNLLPMMDFVHSGICLFLWAIDHLLSNIIFWQTQLTLKSALAYPIILPGCWPYTSVLNSIL